MKFISINKVVHEFILLVLALLLGAGVYAADTGCKWSLPSFLESLDMYTSGGKVSLEEAKEIVDKGKGTWSGACYGDYGEKVYGPFDLRVVTVTGNPGKGKKRANIEMESSLSMFKKEDSMDWVGINFPFNMKAHSIATYSGEELECFDSEEKIVVARTRIINTGFRENWRLWSDQTYSEHIICHFINFITFDKE